MTTIMQETSERKADNEWDMTKAVKVLYPSRYSALKPDGISRFNPLLLEFGEIELQDWAVAASSSTLKEDGISRLSKGKRSSAAATAAAVPWNTSNSLTEHNHNQNKTNPSSTSMKNIHGRLRLCSKSILFEPHDTSRAIIKCPLDKLVSLPTLCHSPNTQFHSLEDTAQATASSSSTTGTTILVSVHKHYLMKADHVVSPFITVDTPTEFRFLFLYSKPTTFMHLIQILSTSMNKGIDSSLSASFSSSLTSQHILSLPSHMHPHPSFHGEFQQTLDPINLQSPWEQVMTPNLSCFLLSPLNLTPGGCVVTLQQLYFQPWKGHWDSTTSHRKRVCPPKASSWSLSSIVATARRYHGLRDVALEIFFQSEPSILLAFTSCKDRESVLQQLSQLPCHTDEKFIAQSLKAWLDGTIDNFEYLLLLNSASGRSFHDLSRYPVFPWVLSDYSSPNLDTSTLLSPFSKTKKAEFTPECNRVFRDLQKPVGALNEQRLEYFQTRYKNMQDMDQAFLYGTHYSAPGYILYYLVRIMPEHMLCLQNGKFDSPDRLFYSLEHCFSSLLTNPADVKECIAQFFDTSGNMDFLYNVRNLPLGVTQNGIRVNDVHLPPWAKSPRDFISKNRMALESDYCSRKLHHWIDLIFGVRSRSDRCIEAMNLFHPTAYMGPKDLEKMTTDEEKKHAELHATEFGIVPDQLFSKPHPHRHMDLSREQGFNVHSFISDLSYRLSIPKEEGEESKEPWEVLKKPKSTTTAAASSKKDENRRKNKAKDDTNDSSSQEKMVDTSDGPPFLETGMTKDVSKINQQGSVSKLSLSGFGDVFSRGGTASTRKFPQLKDIRGGFRDGTTTSHAPVSPVVPSSMDVTTQVIVTPQSAEQYPVIDWEMKQLLPARKIHTDAVSGCILTLDGGSDNSLLTTSSLDGSLMVHTLQAFSSSVSSFSEQSSIEQDRRKFTSRIPYLSSSSSARSTMNNNPKAIENTSVSPPSLQLHLYRSHSSTDPLSTLAVVGDKNGGHIAFVGGHDDVVVAYGIQSGCLLASLYSHRDAVTGISIIPCPLFYKNAFNFTCTHIMITGSWDSTVKLWSVSIASGESVTTDRIPILELFDADTSIVSVAAMDQGGSSVYIAAGCSDGSFLVWSWNSIEGKKLIHKQEVRRGSGPCTSVIWRTQRVSSKEEAFLCVGLGNGRVISHILRDDVICAVSKLHIGSSVHCLSFAGNDILVAGCADGGIRLIPLGHGGHFDYNPRLWKSIHGRDSPRITSLSIAQSVGATGNSFMCAIGAEDGTVSLHEMKQLPGMPQLSDS